MFQERNQNNRTLTTYTRGLDLSGTLDGAGGVGGLVARSDKMAIISMIVSPTNPDPQWDNTSYYHNDGHGNVTALIYPLGAVVATYQYDPFGNLISANGSLAALNKYRFSSKRWDANADLYYYGYRFYDPNLQRWVNRDPLGDIGNLGSLTRQSVISFPFTGGVGSSGISQADFDSSVGLIANLGAFDGNDPVNQIDPDGRCPWCLGALAGAGLDLATQLLESHGSLMDRLRAVNVCDAAVSAAEGAAGGGLLNDAKDAYAAYKAYKLAKDADAVAQGAKDSVLIAKGTAESVANGLRKQAAKDAAKAVGGVVAGQAAKKAINAAASHGNGKNWCTPFK